MEISWENIKIAIGGEEVKIVPVVYLKIPNMNKLEEAADSEFIQNIITRMKEAEEKLIIKVLKNYLQKEPSIEDAKRTSRAYYEQGERRYALIYDETLLGIVQYNYGSHKTPVSINFIPHTGL